MNERTDLEQLVAIFKSLADPNRLRILGALAARPHTGKELAEVLGIGPPAVSHHMTKLAQVGLVSTRREGQSHWYSLDDRTFREIARRLGAAERAAALESGGPTPENAEARERAKVLRDFFDGRRLKQIPAQRKKRVVVLQQLLTWFVPDREYPEREVNDILREAHEDVATLRRELIDYGFMTREGGVYRVALTLPSRSVQVAQEITGDEHAWLRRLLTPATTGSTSTLGRSPS